MAQDRDNNEWIEALQAEGARGEVALSDLRDLLLIGLKTALKSRSDFVDSLLNDFVQDSQVRILRSLRGVHRYSVIGTGDTPMLPKAVSVFVYAVTPYLWRWEIRRGGALLRCGTARSKVAAETDAIIAVKT